MSWGMPDHAHLSELCRALGLPILATVLLEVVESLVETIGWRARLVKTAWDLCVLSVGATAGIFGAPSAVQHLKGNAVLFGCMSLLVSCFCAVLVMHIRKTEHLRGVHSLAAIALGGAALALPWWCVVHY